MVARTFVVSTIIVQLFAASASAASVTVSGYLNDASNLALVASDGYLDLQAARFGDDNEIARNVALYDLTVLTGGTFSFDSAGYAAGGAEPYFTLFAGIGNAASFLDSNYAIAAIDFSLSRFLHAGRYIFALGVWSNQSFAENNPDATPTLGDGFTALGDPGRLGNYYYELGVSSGAAEFQVAPAGGGATPVPEPPAALTLSAALIGLATTRKHVRAHLRALIRRSAGSV